MGTPKAGLEWHGSTLLYRTAALLGRTVSGPVLVVVGAEGAATTGWELPTLPAAVAVVHDPIPGLGPLQGIAAGLAAVGAGTESAFVCATDMPFLHPAFVRGTLEALTGSADVALPVARGHRQPLAAAYRVAVAEQASALLAAGGRTPGELFARCRVTVLDDDTLRATPPSPRWIPAWNRSRTSTRPPSTPPPAPGRPSPSSWSTGGRSTRCAPRPSPVRRTRSGDASAPRSSSTANRSSPTRTSRWWRATRSSCDELRASGRST